MSQRLGRIRVQRFALHRDSFDPTSFLYSLFANFIPLGMTELYHEGGVEFVGVSNMFDPIEEGEVAPLYDVIIKSEVVSGLGMSHVVHQFKEFRKVANA